MQALLPVFLLRMLLEVVQSQRKDRTSSKLLLNPKNRHCLPEARRRTSNLLNKVSPPSSSPAATARISTVRSWMRWVHLQAETRVSGSGLHGLMFHARPVRRSSYKRPVWPRREDHDYAMLWDSCTLAQKGENLLGFGRLTFSSKRMGMAAH